MVVKIMKDELLLIPKTKGDQQICGQLVANFAVLGCCRDGRTNYKHVRLALTEKKFGRA